MTNNYSTEFAYHIHGSGEVFITHRGRLASRLRGPAATTFLMAADAGDPQSVMAQVIRGESLRESEPHARGREYSKSR